MTTLATAATASTTALQRGEVTVVRATRGRLRLRLRAQSPDRRRDRFVDGGWWPHSRDLTAELPPLLAAIEAAGYEPIRRVTYNLTAWDRPPRRLMVGGRLVKLGGFRTQDSALVTLSGKSAWINIDLVTIASDTDPAVAERALVLAASAGDTQRADEIVSRARHLTSAGIDAEDLTGLARWASEGGAHRRGAQRARGVR